MSEKGFSQAASSTKKEKNGRLGGNNTLQLQESVVKCHSVVEKTDHISVCSSGDRATVSGTVCRGFESLQTRFCYMAYCAGRTGAGQGKPLLLCEVEVFLLTGHINN